MKAATMLCALLLFSGCAHVLSDQALQEVDPAVNYRQVQTDPQAWKGSTLVLGGRIIAVENSRTGSTLEILRYTLDRYGQPIEVDEAGGRFLVRSERFLDPELYKEGRLVTLTGTVEGREVRQIDDADYVYPLFRLGEIRLQSEAYRIYPYSPYYYPYYYWDFYYDPWYRYPYRHYGYPYWGY